MKRRKKRKNKDLVKGWKGYQARVERFDYIRGLLPTYSLSEIGKMLVPPISKQRVHQILKGYPKLDPDRANLV